MTTTAARQTAPRNHVFSIEYLLMSILQNVPAAGLFPPIR